MSVQLTDIIPFSHARPIMLDAKTGLSESGKSVRISKSIALMSNLAAVDNIDGYAFLQVDIQNKLFYRRDDIILIALDII